MAQALDEIEIAFCAFDASDRAVFWNRRFLALFPEHDGFVTRGEHYSENLRRFYAARLTGEERELLEQYVSEGVERHQRQQHAYEFDHRGLRIRVSCVDLGVNGRIRLWRTAQPLERNASNIGPLFSNDIAPEAVEALENIADAVMVADANDRALWANKNFLALYGITHLRELQGSRFDQIYAKVWEGAAQKCPLPLDATTLREQRRFAGAPYELPLPRNRWVRIIERRGTSADGFNYFSHVDITDIQRRKQQLQLAYAKVASLARTDGLTGLANRRSLDEALALQWEGLSENTGPISLLMIDLDHFKRLNDSHGHVAGDIVLKEVALILGRVKRRADDLVARYGGEEFAILLPKADLASAVVIAEAIRSSVASASWIVNQADIGPITVSIGVASATGWPPETSATDLVARADEALYRAKRNGRNQVAS